ncbi:unnamed protein product, partial [Ectocarpus sp. 4 AP-2014]
RKPPPSSPSSTPALVAGRDTAWRCRQHCSRCCCSRGHLQRSPPPTPSRRFSHRPYLRHISQSCFGGSRGGVYDRRRRCCSKKRSRSSRLCRCCRSLPSSSWQWPSHPAFLLWPRPGPRPAERQHRPPRPAFLVRRCSRSVASTHVPTPPTSARPLCPRLPATVSSY